MTATAAPLAPSPGNADPRLFDPDAAGTWFLLHTRSRQEKALADQLVEMAVRCFLPLSRQLRYYGPRKAVVFEPLFPGYLFLRGSLDDAYLADRTKRVATIIRVVDQRRLCEELRAIYLAMGRHVPLNPFPGLVKGTRVEVRAGPLQGLRGVVESITHPRRLILQVEVLGRATSVELDGALLERLD